MTTNHVLIVDDEADIRELLVLTLMRMGIEATTARGFEEAVTRLTERAYDLCLTDMRLPDGDGLMVLTHIAQNYGNTPVAVITAFGSTDNAVAALKAGAFDYISKPIQLKQLREVITAALSLPAQSIKRADKQDRRKVSNSASQPPPTGERRRVLLGDSAPIARAREMIGKLARSQAPV
ncbi:MAG: response regulator, partial [Usitatibacteraceae bacterium]